jgi:hypothetical protein
MRKNSQLLIAYTLLFSAAIAVVTYDTHRKSLEVPALSEAEQKAAERRAKGNNKTRIVAIPSAPSEDFAETKVATGPTQPTENQLPRGIFLTKESMTLTATDGSQHELKAGTQVSLIRRDGEKMKVHHDGFDYLLQEDKVTRNVRAVEKLLASRRG